MRCITSLRAGFIACLPNALVIVESITVYYNLKGGKNGTNWPAAEEELTLAPATEEEAWVRAFQIVLDAAVKANAAGHSYIYSTEYRALRAEIYRTLGGAHIKITNDGIKPAVRSMANSIGRALDVTFIE